MSKLSRLFLVSLLLPVFGNAAETYVPDELSEWREWVLEGQQFRECPFFFNRHATGRDDYVCAWPGSLDLAVSADGARFSQQWTVYADDQWLPLPGDASYWPHQVSANGRSIEVVMHEGVPSILVGPGSYRLAGTFAWDEPTI